MIFIDANLLVYAHDRDAGARHDVARSLIAGFWDSRNACLSTQVLQELYVNLTGKLAVPYTEARALIEDYALWPVVQIGPADVVRASGVQERNRLSFWDALVVAAAVSAGADQLLTEDLNAGQIIEGVRVENPFSD